MIAIVLERYQSAVEVHLYRLSTQQQAKSLLAYPPGGILVRVADPRKAQNAIREISVCEENRYTVSIVVYFTPLV